MELPISSSKNDDRTDTTGGCFDFTQMSEIWGASHPRGVGLRVLDSCRRRCYGPTLESLPDYKELSEIPECRFPTSLVVL